MLTPDELDRYARHIALPDFGTECQERLKNSSVLIIGAGGLGSPIALYLAAAGVGRIGIVDGDCVEATNLQRQIIHTTPEIGVAKVESARRKLLALNPHCEVEAIQMFVDAATLPRLVDDYDFVIDATDSFRIKFLINDVCVAAGKPYCHGAIWRYQGQLMTVLPGTPCYRCLFDSMPEPAGPPAGPLGVLPGVIGTLQATEAIKYLAGIGTLLTGTLLRFDALSMEFERIEVPRNPHCSAPHTTLK